MIAVRRVLCALGALILLDATGAAQEPSRILVVDGTRIQAGRPAYGSESDLVRDQARRNPASVPRGALPACRIDVATPEFRVHDSVNGRFTAIDHPEVAYLYSRCDPARGRRQGILVLRALAGRAGGDRFVAHYAYPFRGDVKLATVADLDGDRRNEIAIVSGEVRDDKSVRVVALSRTGVTKFGTHALETARPLRQRRLYAETRPGGAPAFFDDMREMTAAGWRAAQPPQPAALDPDTTNYARGASHPGFRLAEAALLTAIAQTVMFIVLIFGTIVFIVRMFTSGGPKGARARAAAKRAAPALPALQPLKCPACGAGVPLRGDVLVCPSCANRFAAPREYDQIRIFRDDAARRLKRATRYWRMANILASRWMGRVLLALSVWLIASIPLLFIGWDDLAYVERLFKPSVPLVILVGLAYVFWIPTLWMTAGMLSPKARQALPTLETGEGLGTAEAANCAQCGGAIRFDKTDLAAVCGYCGVETYRARLAWRLRNIANDARHRATFSLIDAMKAVRAAVEDIVSTPMIFAFIFIIAPAFVMGLYAAADWLGLTWLLDFFGFFF